MNSRWITIILFLHFYSTEECNFRVNVDDNSKIIFEILETHKVGELIGEIPIEFIDEEVRGLKDSEKIKCTPEEINCSLNESSKTVMVFLKQSVVHYPDDKKTESLDICELICPGETNRIERRFEILIKDINNKHPTFGKKVYKFNVRELTPIENEVNSEVITVYDDDFDVENSQFTVSIFDGDDETFKLEEHSSSQIDRKNFSIILKQRLNYNKQSSYNLTLIAVDRGIPPLNGTTDIILNISDDDDRDPVFEHFLYEVHIIFDKTKEGIIIEDVNNEIILLNESMKVSLDNVKPEKIYAYDPDFGINQTVHYKIGDDKWNKYFEIDKESGAVYLTSSNFTVLNDEKINIPLKAYQTDFEEKTGYACLTVLFTVNASKPYFIHQVDVLNKSLEGDTIYVMNAVGEHLTYNAHDNKYVSVNSTTGAIQLLEDASLLPKYFSVNFTVNTKFLYLNDTFKGNFSVVNREYKESLFKKATYQIEILKYSHKGAYLFCLSKEILDKSVQLSLSGEDVQYFNLLNYNDDKWIVLNEDIPSERENFTLVVDAIKENKEMILERDSAKLIFHVIESDCQLKIFKKEVYIIDKKLDWKIGENIYTVETNLPNTQFFIQDYNEYFIINYTTGEISLRSELDKCQKYYLKVFGYVENPPRNESTELIFHSDVCIKNSRIFNKCVYTWNIDNFEKIEPLNLKDNKFSEENVTFSIISVNNKKDNLDSFKIDESGNLKIIKNLPEGQYFLKLRQEYKSFARSTQNAEIKDIGNNEALIMIQIGKHKIREEKKVLFLHPNPSYKFFLPNAPLSDYNFEIKVTSADDDDDDVKIRIKDNNGIFGIDSLKNEIFPLQDISKMERYHTILTIEAIDFDDKTLDIHIYQLHEDNCLNISVSTNFSELMSKSQIERNITRILQHQNNSQDKIYFHILKYSINNNKNFEIISTILYNKTLLTYKEMKTKFQEVQEQIQDSFGLFRLSSFIKEVNDKDENRDKFTFILIIFGSLAAFLIIIILMFCILSRFKKSNQNIKFKNKLINGNTKSLEQEIENASLQSFNRPENLIVEKSNELDQVDKSTINKVSPEKKNEFSYTNQAYDDHYDEIAIDQNEISQTDHYKDQKKYEDENSLIINKENADSLNVKAEINHIESKTEQQQTELTIDLESKPEPHYSNVSESKIEKVNENNIENNQSIKDNSSEMFTVNINENDLSKNQNQNESDDDDDTEFNDRRFSHRDSLTRLASFSAYVGNSSDESEDEIPKEQGHKRSVVSFNDITEYIP